MDSKQLNQVDNLTAGKAILVIEDNENLNDMYSQTMAKAGYNVYQATTIQQARDFLNTQRFDLLLCDIRMGDGYGAKLLQERLTKLNEDETEVIMVSAEPQYQSLCEEMGIEFFMVKPVRLKTLASLVNRLLSPGNQGQ